jgi:DNA-binding SARP family transcriptional activator
MVVGGPGEGIAVKYRREYRKCGKNGCETCAAGSGHGPYWYAYWNEDGRRRRRYIGTTLPEGVTIPDPEQAVRSARRPASALDEPLPASEETNQGTREASLRVRTLGGFSVRAGGRDISPTRWSEQPRVALLFGCLLRASGHRIERDEAERRLWPDEHPGAHTRDLIEVVRALRLTLDGPGVPSARGYVRVDDGIALAPGLGVEPPADWLDDLAFEEAADLALSGPDLSSCLEADQLYTGDYLPNEGWHDPAINERRTRLQDLHVALLIHLAELCMGQAVTALQRALRDDETEQRAVRLLMRQLAALGARGPALAVYRRLQQVLEREHSGEPDAETLAIQESLLRNMGYLPAPRDEMIGREGALASLVGRLLP